MPFWGGHFQSRKFILQILGTLNRVIWAWNWYKRAISGFRVCFFNTCIDTQFGFPRALRLFGFLLHIMITSTAMVLSATLETSTTAVAQTKIVLGRNRILLRILLSSNIITINIIAIYIIAFNNNITWALLKDEGRLERPAIKERSQPILILPMDVNIVHCAICQVCLIYYISEYCVAIPTY